MEKIDFVITWVDGEDIKWQQDRSHFMEEPGNDDRIVRYRNWDNLHYWFRGVEKYAPWVNKIYFVTCGHVPKWLDTGHEKLVIARHDDFMESRYLPTFNSDAIEVNLHRIKGLSDRFVYFNDDMFITAPVRQADFFVGNKPADRGIENVIPLKYDKDLVVNSIMRNHAMIINSHFDKKKFLKKNRGKWFSLRNGKEVIRNILLSPWECFCGFRTFHLPTPFLKSAFYEMELLEGKILEETSSHRFRAKSDVSQWLFQNWQIVSGNYVLPRRRQGQYFAANIDNVLHICDAIEKQKYRMICINDEVYDDNFKRIRNAVNEAFENIFPEKSSFEK